MKTFGSAELEKLSSAIASGTNTNLQSISASGHHLPPDSLKSFGLALSTQANHAVQQSDGAKGGISRLAIGSKDMGDDGMIALCEGLKESNGGMLQSVDFGWKNLRKESLQAIGATFAASAFLTQLDLSRNNDIGNEGIASLAKASKETTEELAFPSLEKLILSECNIGLTGVQSLAEIILGPLSNRSNPIDLAISSNPIGSESCGTLSTLCAISGRDSVISHLYLSKCDIGDDGIKLLSAAAICNSCTRLTFLDLSENAISRDGAKTFADSLAESWPDLVELKLAKNKLDGEGVAMIMGALVSRSESTDEESAGKKNSTLDNLDLTCTNCGIEGAKAALTSGGLITLRMFNNRLGSDGFCSISPLLRGGHPSIENLDLGGNDAEEDAVVTLLNSIAEREDGDAASSLSVLEIGGNKFGDKAQEALDKLKCVWSQLDVAHDKPVQDAEELLEEELLEEGKE